MPSPYQQPRAADLPITIILTGTIGSTHGVRFIISPPNKMSTTTSQADLPEKRSLVSPRKKPISSAAETYPIKSRTLASVATLDASASVAAQAPSPPASLIAPSGMTMHIPSVQIVSCPPTS